MPRCLTFCVSFTALVTSSCARDDVAARKLDHADMLALSEYGVADVRAEDDRFVLADEDGDPIGEVRLTGHQTVTASLYGDTVRSTKAALETVIECNGREITVQSGDVTPPPETWGSIEECSDALQVAAVLAAAEGDIDTASDDGFRKLAHCIFLGANIWCDGTTSVLSFDSLCMNDPSDPFTYHWVETTTHFVPNGASCVGCCS